MSGIKKVLMALLTVLLAAAVVTGVIWHVTHYVTVDFRFYPRDAESLDLRGQDISIKHYEKLCEKMPECEILWEIPFQGAAYPEDTTEITVTSLSEEDIRALDYLTALTTLQAEGCTDYGNLLQLQERRPEVAVSYSVTLGGESYANTADNVILKDMTAEEVELLAYLPKLQSVMCSGGETAAIARLQEYCTNNGLSFGVLLGGTAIAEDTETVTVEAMTEEELALLQFLPGMKRLHISMPQASAESLKQLRDARPDVTVTWEQEIFGQVCSSADAEIDLSGAKVSDVSQLEQAMAYFPDAETVFLGKSSIDNETLAAWREQLCPRFKLVWTVQLGEKLQARTDDLTFMPVREYVYYFNDEEAYNLRYCEDMVCIDIGHMSIHNIDFVKFMPNLEYLILAHTQLQYIDPISNCKKLKFLELDWSPIKDYSPLLGCTALEDLNLGNTFADFAPIGQMTWLKNLWVIGCSRSSAYQMTQLLTNTNVMTYGNATVANGWRDLPNYYAMRDLLDMRYMSW